MIINNKLSFNKKTALSIAITGILASGHVAAQGAEGDTPTVVDKDVEVIAVTGIRSSLRSSMLDKKASNVVTDGIKAEDLGKFPDLNVAESL